MYKIVKNVISSGRFELSDILKKVDTLWAQGSISDDERKELTVLAREKHSPEAGYASMQAQIAELRERIEALERVNTPTADPDEYPAWKQPTGSHDAYKTGSKMTFTDGLHYICIAPAGYSVSYGPDILPGMWQLA